MLPSLSFYITKQHAWRGSSGVMPPEARNLSSTGDLLAECMSCSIPIGRKWNTPCAHHGPSGTSRTDGWHSKERIRCFRRDSRLATDPSNYGRRRYKPRHPASFAGQLLLLRTHSLSHRTRYSHSLLPYRLLDRVKPASDQAT
jgi:hypothetical protein